MRAALAILAFAVGLPAASAADPFDPARIPHLGDAGREAFAREYRTAPGHKAFLIGPGGSWAWAKGQTSAEDAIADAAERCDRLSSHCVPYAVDDRIVFERDKWAGALGPYPPAADAARAPTGWETGARYFDLGFTLRDGTRTSIAALRGKLVVLQFWGSWCPPCRVEMPAFQKLFDSLKDRADIAFVLLNFREDAATSYRWVDRNNYRLPFADSGSKGREDNNLYLADGTAIPYGTAVALAQVPTTLILDRRGRVIFRKSGATDSWPAMAEQIRHALEHSAR